MVVCLTGGKKFISFAGGYEKLGGRKSGLKGVFVEKCNIIRVFVETLFFLQTFVHNNIRA